MLFRVSYIYWPGQMKHMDNKILGYMLIGASMIIIVLLLFIRGGVVDAYQLEADKNMEEDGVCHVEGEETCPHERQSQAQIPVFIAIALLVGIMSLGIYLIFFEKSQNEIMSALKRERVKQVHDERFRTLLMGMDPEEKKIMKAVREQDGITQQTLRLRTDMHKSKLSIVLDGLEKKGLIKREVKGKTKQVFLKIKA
jgi:uncharacterized membrane protein